MIESGNGVRALQKKAERRRKQRAHRELMEYYRSSFQTTTSFIYPPSKPNPREPIGKLARLIERWANK